MRAPGARRALLAAGSAVLLGWGLTHADSSTSPLYKNRKAALEARVEDLLVRLTQEEKVSLMAGGAAFATQAIPRLDVPALRLSDGPNGVRSNEDQPATVFPTGSALAATWNPDLLRTVGAAIGREARAMGVRVLLGPNVNIQRSPLAGRNFESYSEDPYLAGVMGTAFVEGVQNEGVGTSVKHFVANEQELERARGSSNVDERTLREIYLLPFEMIVKQAKPWTVMAAYNRVNGTYMTESRPLIHDVLQGEWGYDGVVVSDWGAVHSTLAAASSGVDLEMPGPARYFGDRLRQAVQNWQVDPRLVDEAARRMLRLIIRSGALDGPQPAGELLSPRNRSVALDAAREAITLLKNEHDTLPLDRARIRSLAVIGPNADVPLFEGGGSAAVVPGRIATPLMSLRSLLGSAVSILYVRGVDNDPLPPPADARLLSPTVARTEQGLAFNYYANATFEGRPVRSGVDVHFDKLMLGAQLAQMSARWEGIFWAPRDGEYEFSLSQVGDATLSLDDQRILGSDRGTLLPARFDFGAQTRVAKIALKAGHHYRIRVEYVSVKVPFHALHLGVRVPAGSIEEAVRAAQGADAAVVFVGSARATETEGRDRDSMELEGRQNELVSAILDANPHSVVVLNSGAPYALAWADRAPAIIEGWLAGEEGADALAQVLFGEVNPSGHLPCTFPRRLEDNPAYLYYPAGRDANYGEGVFVGYRYYDRRGIEPLFAFGHGLSYTTFEYRNLRVPASVTAGQPIEVSVLVRNTGRRAGAASVQLYVGDEATTEVVRPVKELKGFQKVRLAPGQERSVTFRLAARDLAYYDVHRGDWTSTPGVHRIFIGSSARDIRQQQDFKWAQPQAATSSAAR
ncbi:MAG TPA: glycoside hydrolase family 3 C-terminal domain-containing protein [Steroidobacteraceae bacterium]|nr:glycoside hydrolase family 3 C-terminal domain-containing protein [Steroidobacteraceae bacterium]